MLLDLILSINFNGNPPWSLTYKIDNHLPIIIDSVFDNIFNLPISQSSNYQLIEFNDAACVGVTSGTGQVNLALEKISPSFSFPDAKHGQINLTIQTENPPYDINWFSSVNDATNLTNLGVGVYDLMIRDTQNCLFMDSMIIESPSVIAPECAQDRVIYLILFLLTEME